VSLKSFLWHVFATACGVLVAGLVSLAIDVVAKAT